MCIGQRAAKLIVFALACTVLSLSALAANFYQGVTPATVPWPGGVIPYQFDPSVTPQQQTVYLDGMREWELAAKIHFVPYTNQSEYVILRFDYNEGTNVYAAGNPAIMTVDSLSRAQVCHETGHLLGFQHEHVRTNRNSYITVEFANIQSSGASEGTGSSGTISNLYVIDSNSLAYGPYDFESVMHYSKDLFAVNTNVDVMDPLPPYEPHYFYRIGNFCLSPLDRAGAAYLYGPPIIPLTSIVTNTADVGLGSLRAAIYYANDHPGTTITFDIPTTDPGYSNGVYTIYLTGQLPTLVGSGTVIDATTQPGFAGKPIVAIDGSQILPEAGGSSGVYFYESRCTLRGMAIGNVTGSPVQMLYDYCISNRVQGCFLGLAPDGASGMPSGYESVNIAAGATWNIVGGTNASQRNIISGNSNSYGVTVTGTNTANNMIEGNYIGLDATGTFAVPNYDSGVGIFGGPQNTVVGGTNAGAGNVLSGNTQYGIFVGDPDTTGTVIQGNYIGTDATGNNAVPNVASGIAVFNGVQGVTIGGASPGARNVVSGNTGIGIYFLDASNNVAEGNFVGLNAAGTAAVPNSFAGIYLLGGSQSNLIGGTAAGDANVVSGNYSEGIYIADPGTGNNFVFGNYLGTDPTGTYAIGNGFTGVGVWNGTTNNQIGGTDYGEGNLISGNGDDGVSIGDTNTSGNLVQGNLIGTTPNGLSALGNEGYGIRVGNGASSNLIGGTTSAARNIISGNDEDGVHIEDPGTSANQVFGNYIGVNINGTAALPNVWSGVAVVGGASANLVGTPNPATRNIISGNDDVGVYLSDPGTVSNLIQGNYIGTDISGLNAISNLAQGLTLFNSSQNNLIGGSTPGAGNVIAASASYGVFISDPGTMTNRIQGNYIGVGADGVTPLGNAQQGVVIQSGAQDNIIGLDVTGAGAGNIIANSGAEGVIIYNTNAFGNTVRGNSIYNNARLGINLAAGTENGYGVTANHTGVASGPNDLQNYPIITAASVSGGMTGIAGTLNSTPNHNFKIDLYRNSLDDPSGHGQGKVYLGAASLTTDGSGNGTFLFSASGSFTGQFIATTATDAGVGDTSEFSTSIAATNGSALFALAGPYTHNGGFGFNVVLETNLPYSILASTNLAALNSWVTLTNFTPATSPVSFTDPSATNFSRRFYRVVSP